MNKVAKAKCEIYNILNTWALQHGRTATTTFNSHSGDVWESRSVDGETIRLVELRDEIEALDKEDGK